jgi:transcriptional regulator with XRE-family HTH domain
VINIPTINLVKTGMNITRLRDENGMSVKDLQDLFGFATPQAIYKWQHGTTLPSVDNLVVLAAVFAVQVDDILIIDVNHICK